MAAACNTGTTEMGYESAKKGSYVVSYAYSADKQTLAKAVADALSRRGWNAKPTPDGGFDASIFVNYCRNFMPPATGAFKKKR